MTSFISCFIRLVIVKYPMKINWNNLSALIAVLLLIVIVSCKQTGTGKLQNGDIIFQESTSAQSRAVQLATHSDFSHMGIIYINEGMPYVFEAVQPVKLTELSKWIKRGKDGHYVVKRLKDSPRILTPQILNRMKEAGNRFLGKGYDIYFRWDDELIYCSELVWKVYKEGAGVELVSLQSLGVFDLSHPEVRRKIRERYGERQLPLNEPAVSPAAIFDSGMLYTVRENKG